MTRDEKAQAALAIRGFEFLRDFALERGDFAGARVIDELLEAIRNGTSHPFFEEWERRAAANRS